MIFTDMDPDLPELFESEDSDSDEEELSSSPPAIYGFKPGPDFLVLRSMHQDTSFELLQSTFWTILPFSL